MSVAHWCGALPPPTKLNEKLFGPHSMVIGHEVMARVEDKQALEAHIAGRLAALFVSEGCPPQTAVDWVRSRTERLQRSPGVYVFSVAELVLTVPEEETHDGNEEG